MVRILTDSAADLLPQEVEQMGVTVIPLNVTFADGTVIQDGVEMTPDEYYQELAHCSKLPMTSQPSPELFRAYFEEATAAGDEVVGIFLSSQISGTYQCARLAAEMVDGCTAMFLDSKTCSVGEGLLVRLAVRLRDKGYSAGHILQRLLRARRHVHIFAVVNDLKYLRKGGRLPAIAAFAGGMLGIKLLIHTNEEGKVALVSKARGLPGAYVALFKKIEEMGGIDSKQDCCVGYTSSTREIEPIQVWLTQNQKLDPAIVGQMGCVIGTHAGPGTFAFAFFDAKDDEPEASPEDKK